MIGAMKRKASLSLSESTSSHVNVSSSASPCGGTNAPTPSSVVSQHSHNGHGGGSGAGSGHGGHHHSRLEKRIRWDGPRTQSLIEHYKNNEYLWNPKLADYKNDKKRTHSLESWLAHNNLDPALVNEVKMKLHGLRTSFGHQLKLEYSSMNDIEKGVKTEDSGPFVSKWQWYNQLAFLRDTMTFRSGTGCSNLSPSSDSPPPDGHPMMITNQQLAHQQHHHHEISGHQEDMELVKTAETPPNLPIDMQVMPHYATQSGPSETHDYVMHHHHHASQPHNLSVSSIPVSIQIHDPHSGSLISHSRKDEDDPLGYHHGPRITATPPMAHMQSITSQHSQQPTLAHASQPEMSSRYQNGCATCSCSDKHRQSLAEKLGRLVEETMNNLHPEYQEMAKHEIQQVLGKYLQKPIP